MRQSFLVDECLSVSLVALAKERGISAGHVGWLGKGGWHDHNLVSFVLENDYVFVTNNRRHFLKEYAKLEEADGVRKIALTLYYVVAPRTAILRTLRSCERQRGISDKDWEVASLVNVGPVCRSP